MSTLAYKHSTKNKIDSSVFTSHDYQKFEKITKQIGAEKSYQILKKQYPNNEPDAHDFAHVIGLIAFEQKGTDGLAICDTAFNYGCSHGFIEGFIIRKGVGAVGEIETSCINFGPIHAPSCLHGIGHGLMINSAYKIDPALKDCDILKESSRIYCWDGAFMEGVIGSMKAKTEHLEITAENLDEPCTTVAKIYKSQCIRNQVTVWISYFNDSKKVLSHCLDQEKEYQQICTESVGLINTINSQGEISLLLDRCSITNGNLSDDCLIGELKELLFEGQSPQLAQSLCGFVKTANNKRCLDEFNIHFSQYQQRFSKN